MKKIILLCLAVFGLASITQGQINRQESDEIIAQYIKDKISDEYLLYFYDDTISSQISIYTWWDTLNTQDAYIYFIDEMPNANWTHPCRYIFVDKRNGILDVISASTPPYNPEFTLKTPTKFSTQSERYEKFKILPSSISHIDNNNERYAVILSGGGSKESNHERYWNDCSLIYKILVQTYKYKPENIYVIMADGTDPGYDRRKLDKTYDSSPLDLDGNGTNDIQYSATKSNISAVFNTLSAKLTPDDNLLVFTTDHGSRVNGVSALVLWNNVLMYPSEFAAELNKVHSQNICVVMEQCYSGGFISSLEGDGRIIMTACKADEVSWSLSGSVYDEFVYHWCAALQNSYPSGAVAYADKNGNGIISMKESFEYAKTNDIADETPQYSSKNEELGEAMSLWGTCLTTNIQNQVISASQKIVGCSIKAQNISVTGNAALTLEALEQVELQGTFEVATGATMEIKVSR